MAEIGKNIVGENDSDNCMSGYNWLYGWEIGVGVDGNLWEDAAHVVLKKRIT